MLRLRALNQRVRSSILRRPIVFNIRRLQGRIGVCGMDVYRRDEAAVELHDAPPFVGEFRNQWA